MSNKGKECTTKNSKYGRDSGSMEQGGLSKGSAFPGEFSPEKNNYALKLTDVEELDEENEISHTPLVAEETHTEKERDLQKYELEDYPPLFEFTSSPGLLSELIAAYSKQIETTLVRIDLPATRAAKFLRRQLETDITPEDLKACLQTALEIGGQYICHPLDYHRLSCMEESIFEPELALVQEALSLVQEIQLKVSKGRHNCFQEWTPESKNARPCRHCGSRKHWDYDCKHARKGMRQVRANLVSVDPEPDDLQAQADYDDLYYNISSEDKDTLGDKKEQDFELPLQNTAARHAAENPKTDNVTSDAGLRGNTWDEFMKNLENQTEVQTYTTQLSSNWRDQIKQDSAPMIKLESSENEAIKITRN
ncbi:hypothetical protein BDQ17DRAFT_1438474 [Cyathus striatus]|nr:hypothetical protein BDQ17DRAFT_1438474 [Cyathus striatus]